MALTEAEKERRRAATNARNRAHHARWRELERARKRAAEEISERFSSRIADAEAAEASLRRLRAKTLADIDAQIADLQERRRAFLEQPSIEYEGARARTRAIYDEKHAAEQELESAIDEQFPDMRNQARWSAAYWRPIEEFLK